MKAGDVVLVRHTYESINGPVKYNRIYVALNVRRKNLDDGTNAFYTGIHLFRGFCYQKERHDSDAFVRIGPLNLNAYGKIEDSKCTQKL